MRRSILSLALSSMMLLPAIAHADTFNFSTGDLGGFSASGTLTATNNGDGSFLITNITGAGLGYIGPGDPFFGNDNLLFPGASRILDVNGFAFTELFNGITYSINIFTDNTGFQILTLDSNSNINFGSTTFQATSATATAITPEPSSIILLTTGLGSLVMTGLRRRLAA